MSGASAVLAGLSVLVVEDEFLVAIMLADALEEAGARVVGPAGSRDEGLALIEAGGIQAAVVDWNLAGHCGDSLARALAAREVPFVIATGYGAVSAEFSAVPVLAKPFDHEGLITLVARLTGR